MIKKKIIKVWGIDLTKNESLKIGLNIKQKVWR